ncbi:MAG: hypothetical protein CMO35_03035, partial [Verrucomicrobiaceae bacterium]|nr:hypothetical protein [Verrucomicrobiaceae bacterium]
MSEEGAAQSGKDPEERGGSCPFVKGESPLEHDRPWDVAEEGSFLCSNEGPELSLEDGAREAWRQSARCIGRLHWQSLQVVDARGVRDLDSIFEESVPHNPLIFVLSVGVDPIKMLTECAVAHEMGERFGAIALGQGQAPAAVKMIDEGVVVGNWVFLANCHLMTSWLGELEKIVDGLGGREPHADFRLWLSSSPNPKFPRQRLPKLLWRG